MNIYIIVWGEKKNRQTLIPHKPLLITKFSPL